MRHPHSRPAPQGIPSPDPRTSRRPSRIPMPRDLPLSNGKLMVCFDLEYRIRDIYYPHVGKENHATGHPFRFGVWVDGKVSWMGKEEWRPVLRYAPESLVTQVVAKRGSGH